jgi:hypothetical protein
MTSSSTSPAMPFELMENLTEVAKALNVHPRTIIKWNTSDEDWPKDLIMVKICRPFNKMKGFEDYWLPEGALVCLTKIYPKRKPSAAAKEIETLRKRLIEALQQNEELTDILRDKLQLDHP